MPEVGMEILPSLFWLPQRPSARAIKPSSTPASRSVQGELPPSPRLVLQGGPRLGHMEEMEIDAAALGLDVRPYKLLLYEHGGHFKFHRDTEKEDCMFGTMILQPDAVWARGTGYFQTVFFCDCEHKLSEVTRGTVQKYGWDECYSGAIEPGLSESKDKKPGIISFAERLRESGLQDAVCGYDREALKIVSMAPAVSLFLARCLVRVVKKWGESSVPRMEEFWEKKLEVCKASWEEQAGRSTKQHQGFGYRGGLKFRLYEEGRDGRDGKLQKLDKLQKEGRRKLSKAVDLEFQGCHDAAMAFARRGIEISSGDVLMWITRRGSSFYIYVPILCFHGIRAFIREVPWRCENQSEMGESKENCGEHEVAGLFGVKKNEKVTWLFLELFSGTFEKCGCNMRELVEVAIWLGDEETVRSLVKCTRSGSRWRMLPSTNDSLFILLDLHYTS
ncbi:hypothetical protein SELMODRAFT_438413 [Selaginella moellendorffii]|uniref:Prolyl 4-hydroxylase alpha subunit Fe(2+) 2OG dioxygenase domain-containing protein n=1 Tax=Selaginella moellendorffii TaxID=88036 RepID=D8QXU3_SELML|nr:hypothetical protein SELMODRAFT_438413 [Selaginella moellendorffii]